MVDKNLQKCWDTTLRLSTTNQKVVSSNLAGLIKKTQKFQGFWAFFMSSAYRDFWRFPVPVVDTVVDIRRGRR